MSNCGAQRTTNATICDSRLRTINVDAKCGSSDDIFYFSPWRAPGSAPVLDSCGAAGGRFPGTGFGKPGSGASFQNSSVSKLGDLGSVVLPPVSSAQVTTWHAGGTAEAGWTLEAQHGGGYAYRLAPAAGPLTEETFGKMPLDFVGNSILRWDGNRSTQLEFNATARGWETNKGTTPPVRLRPLRPLGQPWF
eukprot:COSAG04_NODE_5_length_50521_cov_24.772639_50_plen_192_part_00